MKVDRNELDRITAYLREKDINHVLMADIGHDILVSMGCTQEDFYGFLMAIAQHTPEMGEIIVAVAEELAEGADFDEVVN